jgi:carboxyl-terminal processing protease
MNNEAASHELDEMLNRAARLIEERHVLPQAGGDGAKMLRAAIADRRYRRVYEVPDKLAELVTADLRAASGDRHLYLEHLRDEKAPEDDWIAKWRAEGPSQNWGVKEVRLLPGNVGYLKLESFYTYELATPALAAAMELIRHSSGLVLDLSDNGGGDGETADAITETFLDAGEPRPLVIETRAGREKPGPPPDLKWPRYGRHRPLVVMINQRTFSAPEAVSYALQQDKRAVVIGSRSGGGANIIDEPMLVAPRFKLGVPTSRPVGRVTNSNWEGVGVRPDVAAPGDGALWQAWELIRRRLGGVGVL